MKNKILEEFDSIILDSSQIKYLDDAIDEAELLNQFHIRAFVNGNEREYLFYEVLEVTQRTRPKTESTTNNKLILVENNDWIDKYVQKRKGSYSIEIKDFSLFKHYIFYIQDYEFNILAEGYNTINKFFEIFRKYESMKNLIL